MVGFLFVCLFVCFLRFSFVEFRFVYCFFLIESKSNLFFFFKSTHQNARACVCERRENGDAKKKREIKK